MSQPQTPSHVQLRKTPKGWNIQLDTASYAALMVALGDAADLYEKNGLPRERERAANVRALRSALSKAERG